MKEEILNKVLKALFEEGWRNVVVELRGSPFELEEEIKKRIEGKISHFWSPGSRIGVIVFERGKRSFQIFWVLGKRDRIISMGKEGGSSEVIEGISSMNITDPYIIAFKERY